MAKVIMDKEQFLELLKHNEVYNVIAEYGDFEEHYDDEIMQYRYDMTDKYHPEGREEPLGLDEIASEKFSKMIESNEVTIIE